MKIAEILEVARQSCVSFMSFTKGFIGTGFVVGPIIIKSIDMQKRQVEFTIKNTLCTCKHVVDHVEVDELWFNTYSKESALTPRRIVDVQRDMTPPVQWHRHPQREVDMVVTRFLSRGEPFLLQLTPDMIALKGELLLGQRVYVIGFPGGIGAEEGMSSMKPIVKQGIIANLDLAFEILVDIQIQGGSSGSMMLAEFPGEKNPLKIAGVIASKYIYDPHLAKAFPADCILDCIYKTDLRRDLPEEEKTGFDGYRDTNWPGWKA